MLIRQTTRVTALTSKTRGEDNPIVLVLEVEGEDEIAAFALDSNPASIEVRFGNELRVGTLSRIVSSASANVFPIADDVDDDVNDVDGNAKSSL